MAAIARAAGSLPVPGRRRAALRGACGRIGMTLLALAVLAGFLMPLAWMGLTALKDQAQITDRSAPLLPATQRTFEHEGEQLPILAVPIDGAVRELAIVRKGREESDFVDPANPAAGAITW